MSTAETSGPDAVLHGPEGLPEHTLGWQILKWCTKWLRQPDGPDAGQPWKFTTEQARFVLWWYAIDAAGRWVYRTGTLRRMKGWGKDPVGAVLCAVEFAGPCRFSHWDGDTPVAIPHPAPWVQTVAVSQDQTRNTMRLFPGLMPKGGAFRREFDVDMGKTLIYGRGGQAVIEAVTSSPDALEGGRTTFTLCNERQYWRSTNEGHAMAEVIEGNAVKSRDGSARALSICNAHVPGEDTSGERDWDAYLEILAGTTKTTGFLYDSREALPGTALGDEASLRAGILAARGDSWWLDVDRIVATVFDPRTTASESRRKYLNQVVAAEDAWVAPHEWDALADATEVVADGEMVTLGFDGSLTDDHSALMACRVSDGYVFTLGVWDPDGHPSHEHCADGGCGEAPRDLIDAAVLQAKERFDVVGFFSDLHPFESYVDKWADDFDDGRKGLCVKATSKHPIAWDMRSRTKEFTLEGAERMHNEILEAAFSHDGDSRVAQHVHNARRRPNAWGVSFGKEHRESARKIDSLPAATLARMCRRAYLALPKSKLRRKRTGNARFV